MKRTQLFRKVLLLKFFFINSLVFAQLESTIQLQSVDSVRIKKSQVNTNPQIILETDFFNYNPNVIGLSTNEFWSLSGNVLATGNEFLGTLTNNDLIFKRNNVFAGRIGANNTSFGLNAFLNNTTGLSNSAFGTDALSFNTEGYANSAYGTNSLRNNISGYSNSSFGINSLYFNTSGVENSSFGMNSMFYMSTGSNNVAIGVASLGLAQTGNQNTAIGRGAGSGLISGDNNVFIGAGTNSNISNTSSNQLNIADKIYGSGINNTVAIGIGVQNPQARLHTKGNLRFEDLPTNSNPTGILGTDVSGNVFNYNPNSLISSNINLYNSNGSLNENRLVSLKGYNLNFVHAGKIGVGTDNLFSKFTIDDDTSNQFTDIEPLVTDVKALFEIRSNIKRGLYNKFNISQFKKFTWMQSSLYNESPSILSVNPLGGNVGIGVLDATAQLHTIKSVRFEDLPFSERPNAILGTDIDGNVFNYDPSQFGGGTTQDAWLLNGNVATNPGTGPGQNFLGTTDVQDLVFGVNSEEKIRIKPSGRIQFFGWAPSYGANSAYNMFIGGGNDGSSTGNIAVGVGSLINNTTGTYNTALGFSTLENNTTGISNTSIGFQSLRMNTTGHSNVSMGVNSMFHNTTGEYNVSVGTVSLLNNTTGNGNVGIGGGALRENTSGNGNTAVGGDALRETNGTYNTAYGVGALANLGSDISGIDGNANIALGSYAGKDLIKGDGNIFIGYDVQGPISNTDNNQLNIGNWIFGKNGQIAIGSFTDLPQAFITNNDYKLIVKNGIRTEKVRVDIASVKNWADYVFSKDYSLMPLNELENYILINGHLPNIPKAEEVVRDGVDLGEMSSKLLEKIEELTLHTIELNKKNESQQKLIDDLVQRLEKLEKNTKQ